MSDEATRKVSTQIFLSKMEKLYFEEINEISFFWQFRDAALLASKFFRDLADIFDEKNGKSRFWIFSSRAKTAAAGREEKMCHGKKVYVARAKNLF